MVLLLLLGQLESFRTFPIVPELPAPDLIIKRPLMPSQHARIMREEVEKSEEEEEEERGGEEEHRHAQLIVREEDQDEIDEECSEEEGDFADDVEKLLFESSRQGSLAASHVVIESRVQELAGQRGEEEAISDFQPHRRSSSLLQHQPRNEQLNRILAESDPELLDVMESEGTLTDRQRRWLNSKHFGLAASVAASLKQPTKGTALFPTYSPFSSSSLPRFKPIWVPLSTMVASMASCESPQAPPRGRGRELSQLKHCVAKIEQCERRAVRAMQEGRYEEAIDAVEDNVKTRTRYQVDESSDLLFLLHAIVFLCNAFALEAMSRGKTEAAESLLGRAEELTKKKVLQQCAVTETVRRGLRSATFHSLALLLRCQGRMQQGFKMLQRALKVVRQKQGMEVMEAATLLNMSLFLCHLSRPLDASTFTRVALSLLADHEPEAHKAWADVALGGSGSSGRSARVTALLAMAAVGHHNLAALQWGREEEEAKKNLRQAESIARTFLGSDSIISSMISSASCGQSPRSRGYLHWGQAPTVLRRRRRLRRTGKRMGRREGDEEEVEEALVPALLQFDREVLVDGLNMPERFSRGGRREEQDGKGLPRHEDSRLLQREDRQQFDKHENAVEVMGEERRSEERAEQKQGEDDMQGREGVREAKPTTLLRSHPRLFRSSFARRGSILRSSSLASYEQVAPLKDGSLLRDFKGLVNLFPPLVEQERARNAHKSLRELEGLDEEARRTSGLEEDFGKYKYKAERVVSASTWSCLC
eukprot:402964-Hanusia_phi.AAC.1